MNKLIAGLENPELNDTVDNQPHSTGYPVWCQVKRSWLNWLRSTGLSSPGVWTRTNNIVSAYKLNLSLHPVPFYHIWLTLTLAYLFSITIHFSSLDQNAALASQTRIFFAIQKWYHPEQNSLLLYWKLLIIIFSLTHSCWWIAVSHTAAVRTLSYLVTIIRALLWALGLRRSQRGGEIQVALLRELVWGDRSSSAFHRRTVAHLHTADFVQDVQWVTRTWHQTGDANMRN